MYPTQKQILTVNPKIKSIIKSATLAWKDEYLKDWKNLSKKEQIDRLKILILWLNWANHKRDDNLKIKLGDEYQYDPRRQTIYIDKNHPSIMSTLHELGHHIAGLSELKACRWSVWLFIECFPGLYKNLKWNKHLLIKK